VAVPAVGGRGELTSLDERLGLILVVRCGIVAIVVGGSLVVPAQLGITIGQTGPLSAAYLVLAGAVEWYRRGGRRGRLHVHRAMLPLDSVYLALITAPTGGPRSELEFLFAIHLIAVTLLASPRTGIRIALWDSFLFIFIATFTLEGQIGRFLGVRLVQNPDTTQVAVAIMAFWAVALCTAFFSSVSERELRRSKAELSALASLAAELEQRRHADQILPILLRASLDAFGFARGAVYWGDARRALAFAARAAKGGAAEMRVEETVLEPPGPFDMSAALAHSGHTPALLRCLDPQADPILSGLVPGARNVVVVPLASDGEQAGVLCLERGGTWHQTVPNRTLAVLEQFATHTSLVLRSARLLVEVERLAAVDGLTGLANRRKFEDDLAREVGRALRTREYLSLLVVDVDHFKRINDSRGHLTGDEVLRSLGRVLADQVRGMDLVARYGGEEFAVLLPGCPPDRALQIGERIRAAVAAAPELLGVTVSGGVAAIPNHADSGMMLVAAADKALYAAKHAGRDRMACSGRRRHNAAVAL
jgi:diguanylate cyclase (GGDEF)-like protein